MNKHIAILDLGTNTFHLLIIEVKGKGQFNTLFKTEKFVKLAEDGISHIGPKAFARGIAVLKEYKQVIEQHQPEKVFAFGTAALRNANNAGEFVKQVFEETGIEVKVISGDEEATLIYNGVRQAVELGEQPSLIMDIGGGSTEFIIANKDEIFWKQSFPLGVSILKPRFHLTEPVSTEEKNKLVQFLEQELSPLFEQKKNYAIQHLVGASGSFDTYASMIAIQHYPAGTPDGETGFDMKPQELKQLFLQLEKATLEERLKMRGLLAFRAEMIVVAAILTEVVMEHFAVTRITQSVYALKEGMIVQLI